MQAVFLFTGLEDEGFEMLEQLAYLYLANNKVSHIPDFQVFVLSANLNCAYMLQQQVHLLHVHFTALLFYFILFYSDTLT